MDGHSPADFLWWHDFMVFAYFGVDDGGAKMKEQAPICSICGVSSSEDSLTLRDCGRYYLCDDCYYKERREGDAK